MTQQPWVSKEEMLKNGFTIDGDLDDVPSYKPKASEGDATGLDSRIDGESSPPTPGAKPPAP